ncbi:MAG: putative Nitrate/nitrite response regulator protein narL [Frankiales bacterium]|jgi:two-component system nitrate/nitrite response regulator NarL|nr:putative Nitrate/nitrite response regulator protein narL [Frankiales bacterium]
MRVLVVTEIRLYRDGVADALRQLPDVESAISAANGAQAVVAARDGRCDVALVDIALPDSIATARALVTARPVLKVVALGVADDAPELVACAEAGICGYVPRDATLAELVDALRSVLRGEAACSGRVAAGLIRHIARQASTQHRGPARTGLTRREHDVLELVERGLTNKEIARALDLELSTVKNHVHNLLAKFGVADRGQMVASLAPRPDPYPPAREAPVPRPPAPRASGTPSTVTRV